MTSGTAVDDMTSASPAWRAWFAPAGLQVTVIRLLAALLFVGACAAVPNFASSANLSAILFSASATGLAAVGLAAITLSGNLFSLSMGATAAFSSIIFAGALGTGVVPAAVAALAFGAVAGAIQGVIVGLLRCNPIITSIAAASITTGIGSLWSGGRTIIGEGSAEWLGMGALIPGLPYQALIVAALVAVLEFAMQRSRLGREIRLVGSNREAADLAGLRSRSAVFAAYLLAGVSAAGAGVLIGSQSGTGNLLVGADLDFSAIAAVLVGGVAINGGRGRLIDAAFGALFLALVANILLVKGMPYEVQLMVKGLVVLMAVAAGALLSRRAR